MIRMRLLAAILSLQFEAWATAAGARTASTERIARTYVARLAAHRAIPPWSRGAAMGVDHLIVDGDVFALHHHLSGDGADGTVERVDLWRVAGHRIVEHWAVIQPVPAHPVNATGMGCGPSARTRAVPPAGCTVGNSAKQRAESLAVVEAYLAAGDGPLGHAGAVERYVANDFVQHSAHIAPGKAALATYFVARDDARRAAGRTSTTLHLLAQGDLVLLHRKVVSADSPLGSYYADVFRVKDGRVAEHWDVIETIAPDRHEP